MTSNNGGKNLNELLRAGGYDVSDGVNFPDYLGQLSRPILRRVRILKKYQMESLEIESQFYKRVHELEKEFQPLFDEVNSKRAAVVSGEYELIETDEELPPLINDMEAEALEKLENDAPVEGGEPSKGIPGFWFHTLNSVASISDIIKEYDEPILKYLIDITTEVHKEPTGFSLLFHFAENPYFTNAVLTKYYEVDIDVDKQKPFDYDGPNIVKGQGTEINWKEGKNVTQKIVKKKQKKGAHAGKFITKTVSNESFFNFFDPKVVVISEDMDEIENQKASDDIEIGQTIRDQVVTRAVLFFTGEAADDDDYDEFDDEDEEEEGDGSDGSADE
uniref:Nucleosome assembly protein n=1 Tax=Globodera rostochiensis TaxID=31243 RepID=A0A914GWV7_GLORO